MGSRSHLTLVAILVWYSLSCLGPVRGQETRPLPFSRGETLTYDVTWSVFTAGEVVATLGRTAEGAGDPYEVKTIARSRGFASVLFKVENEFNSVFDPRTMCSRQIFKRINEGRRHKETRVVFDSARKLAILDEKDLTNPNSPPKHAENEIPECAEDVITAFYFVRESPLQVGRQFMVPINDGSKTHNVVVDVQARERIETPAGSRFAFRVEPKVFGDLYSRRGRMLIWFSDDDQRLPLRIKAMISLGVLTGTLKSVTSDAAPGPPSRR